MNRCLTVVSTVALSAAVLGFSAASASAQAAQPQPATPKLRQCTYSNVEYNPLIADAADRRRFAAMMQCLINNERISRGLPQVAYEAALADSA